MMLLSSRIHFGNKAIINLFKCSLCKPFQISRQPSEQIIKLNYETADQTQNSIDGQIFKIAFYLLAIKSFENNFYRSQTKFGAR